MTQKDYIALVNRSKQLSYEYYVQASPTVSDAQFDALVSEIEQAESDHPEWTLADSPTQQVGSDLQDNGRRLIRHRTRMLSCQKAQTQEAVTKWLTQTEKKLKGAQVYALEWKYDGISCSLVYQNGTLVSAATRGGKDCGQDLLAHVMRMPSVPQYIDIEGRVEVRGEIVCPKAELAVLGYKDCRTAAAALTNQAVPTSEVERLVFLAWQMDSDEQPFGTESASIVAAQKLGFHAEDVRNCEGGNILSVLDGYTAERDALPYPTDGVVIKIDNKQAAASLGYTEHHPKGNIAYKFGAQKAVTRVVRIEICIGATGKRTPVAYLEPVMIMGREVKQASLYSENKMTEMGVTEGCTVEVGLSNDVTPKIYKVVANDNVNDNVNVNDNDNVNVNHEPLTMNQEPLTINPEPELNPEPLTIDAFSPQPSYISPHTSAIRHQKKNVQEFKSSRVQEPQTTKRPTPQTTKQDNLLLNSEPSAIRHQTSDLSHHTSAIIHQTSDLSPQPSDISHHTSDLVKTLGGLAAMSVVLLVIWQTGLLIPLGILGLITSGLLK